MFNPKGRFGSGFAVLLTIHLGVTVLALGLGRRVHYVLPDGYIGAFNIIVDEAKGAEALLKDGRYTYEVPPTGILRVKSFDQFRGMHEETASYRNGTEIPVLDSSNDDDNVISLRDAGTHEKNYAPRTITLVIGTKHHLQEVIRDLKDLRFDFDQNSLEAYNRKFLPKQDK